MNNLEEIKEIYKELDPFTVYVLAKEIKRVGTNRFFSKAINKSEQQISQAFKGKQPGTLREIYRVALAIKRNREKNNNKKQVA